MSRIIVKNLPDKITEESLKKHFSDKGTLTDLKLKYKNGVFRRYAFIGYEKEEEAKSAVQYFDGTFFKHCRITVEVCTDETRKNAKKWSKQEQNIEESINLNNESPVEIKNKDDYVNNNNNDDGNVKEKDINEEEDENEEENKLSTRKDLSDLDYLKSLKTNKSTKAGEDNTKNKVKSKKEWREFYTIVIKATGFCKGQNKKKKHLTKQNVKAFIKPLKYDSLRIDRKTMCMVAFVGFKTEKLMKQALMKDNSFIDGARVRVLAHEKSKNTDTSKGVTPWSAAEERLKAAEPVAESGLLFIRNLWYSVTEDDLRQLLQQYGELSEITVPVDKVTRQIKGYATAVFLFPENAVRAMNELDGTDFKGRCLHVLPGMPRDSEDKEKDSKGGFKEEKEKNLKATAGSWHNWNTLFLGPSAVIDAVAEKTKLSKQQLLSSDGKTSVAVNLAIGEAAIVDEVKKTLEAEGVTLSAFNNPSTQRSSTVMLVKNLPASTTANQLQELFGRYGELGRVVLPPSGVTGIVEYLDPAEAKKGFRELAYSRFGSGMLYLEWAPIEVFAKEFDPSTRIQKEINEPDDTKSTATLISEPNATLYVKNLNFETTEERLKEHFEREGTVITILIAKKRGLSQGYGFVQYCKKASAMKALRSLQDSKLDGHNLLIKLSEKILKPELKSSRLVHEMNEKTSCKIICKNIPFQATTKEIRDLFSKFGDLKSVRLPEKTGSSEHRGFGFIEYTSSETAKIAYESLAGSTHLYGRRLVLDWAKEDESVDDIRKRTAEQFLASSTYKSNKRTKFDINSVSEVNKDDE